jgi:hypothetical protein
MGQAALYLVASMLTPTGTCSCCAQEHLLNPQTGTFDPVHLEELGVEVVRLSGRAERGMHDALERPSFRIELWYSPTGDWLALQTRTRQGRLMRYEKLS